MPSPFLPLPAVPPQRALDDQIRLAVRDALQRSSRKPLQWGGLAGYQQLAASAEGLRAVPPAAQTAGLRQLATQISRAVETCRPRAADLAAAHDRLQQIAATLGYAAATSADRTPPLPPPSSQQIRADLAALMADSHPAQPAQAALARAWHRLWLTWGPELLHCYDIPGVPPDNLRLEAVFGQLRRHQRRLSGVASTAPLHAFGQRQVLFDAPREEELLRQLRSVPLAAYQAQRRQVAQGEARRQFLRRLHRDPGGTVTQLLQQHTAAQTLPTSGPPPSNLRHAS